MSRPLFVWSVQYEWGRSPRKRRKWFTTERAAQEWLDAKAFHIRKECGPFRHRIPDAPALAAILNTYAGDNGVKMLADHSIENPEIENPEVADDNA